MIVVRHLVAVLLVLVVGADVGAQRGKKTPRLDVERGGTARHMLSGRSYSGLTGVRVMQGKRLAKGISASLSRQGRRGRSLTVKAGERVALGRRYVLQGMRGKKVAMTIPLVLNVVAARERAPARKPTPRRPTPRKPTPGRPAPAKTAPKEAARASFKISRSGRRTLDLRGRRYRGVSKVRVMVRQGRELRTTKAVRAKLSRTRTGVTVQLDADAKAALKDYVLQYQVGRQWSELPLQMTLTDRSKLTTDGAKRVVYRHSEVIILPDGTRISVGDETNPFEGLVIGPSPLVDVYNWAPYKSGLVGGTLEITGAALQIGVDVYIGDVKLDILEQSYDTLTVQLPANSDDCPPGALVVRQGSTQVRKCRSVYFVHGDKPFHHIVDSSSHRYLNSYLLARLSRWIYNDYHSVNNWIAFKTAFKNKVEPLGANKVVFIKPNGNAGAGDTELAIIANPLAIVIAFRGSESPTKEMGGFKDWFHTNTDMDRKSKNSWREGCWVHEGFYNAYSVAHAALKLKLNELRDNDQPIFITGHSLGGALSVIAAMRLKKAGYPIRAVYTFGSPYAGNDEWVKAYQDEGLYNRTQRWVNGNDFAPRFPPAGGWHHVGKTNNIYADGTIKLDDVKLNVLVVSVLAHSIDGYGTKMFSQLSSSNQDKVLAATVN